MVNAGTAATAEPNGRFALAVIDVEGIEGRINSSLLKRVQNWSMIIRTGPWK